jgi:hypothetical protein
MTIGPATSTGLEATGAAASWTLAINGASAALDGASERPAALSIFVFRAGCGNFSSRPGRSKEFLAALTGGVTGAEAADTTAGFASFTVDLTGDGETVFSGLAATHRPSVAAVDLGASAGVAAEGVRAGAGAASDFSRAPINIPQIDFNTGSLDRETAAALSVGAAGFSAFRGATDSLTRDKSAFLDFTVSMGADCRTGAAVAVATGLLSATGDAFTGAVEVSIGRKVDDIGGLVITIGWVGAGRDSGVAVDSTTGVDDFDGRVAAALVISDLVTPRGSATTAGLMASTETGLAGTFAACAAAPVTAVCERDTTGMAVDDGGVDVVRGCAGVW